RARRLGRRSTDTRAACRGDIAPERATCARKRRGDDVGWKGIEHGRRVRRVSGGVTRSALQRRPLKRSSVGRGVRALAIAMSVFFGLPSAAFASPVRTTSFPLGTVDQPIGVTTGPDGNLWVTQLQTSRVVRVTPSGL